MNALRAKWHEAGPPVRAVALLVAFVVAVNVAFAALGAVTGGSAPGGPAASAFATGDDGLAAYADLLRRDGRTVTRLRSRLDDGALPPNAILVVAEPEGLTGGELTAVAAFVDAGGHLVVAGPTAAPLVVRLLGAPLGSRETADRAATPLVPASEVTGVERVVGHASALESTGPAVPILGDAFGRPVAALASVGAGRVVVIADAGPLMNANLARADNAAFGLASAGGRQEVIFAEAQHGYGRGASGLSAIPERWRWAMGGLAVAALVGVWSRGRRFGPPEADARTLAPSRQLYVTAVATALAKTGTPADVLERGPR